MSLPFRSNGACPDALTLGRFVDDDLAGPEARRLVAHVEACPACRNEVERLERLRTFVTVRLGEEDEAAAGSSRSALEQVRLSLLNARHEPAAAPIGDDSDAADRSPSGPPRGPWWRAARRRGLAFPPWRTVAAAASLAAVVVSSALVLDRWSVAASAERLLSEAQVVERAWRYQPGKIRVEVVDTTWRHADGRVDRAVTTLWFNNLPGQEGYTARRYDAQGRLRAAWWMKTDGWSAQFVGEGVNRLSLDPAIGEVEALVPGLGPEDQAAVRYWLADRQKQVRPLRLAATLAALMSEAGEVAPSQERGRPTLLRAGPTYILRYPVKRTLADGRRVHVEHEDTLRVEDLARERSHEREFDANGNLVSEVERRAVSRRDSTIEEFTRLMDEVDGGYPAHWTIVRRTPADILAWARRAWRSRPVQTPGGEPTRSQARPSTD